MTTSKRTMWLIIIPALVLTLVRLAIIHYYVDWKFLWGGDQVPILNLGQMLKSIFSLELPWRNLGILFVPQISFALISFALTKIISLLALRSIIFSNNSIGWIVNSVWFFVGTLILWYVTSSFTYFNKKHKIASYITLIILFAFNPWSTIDTFKSYLGATSILAFLSFTLLAFYFRLIKYLIENIQIKKYEILYIIAVSMILYGVSPSASIRGFTLLAELEIFFIILILITYYIRKPRKNVNILHINKNEMNISKIIILSLIPIIVSSSYILFYLLAGYLAPLRERVVSRWGSLKPPTHVLYPPYANILNSFIGLTSWIAHSQYMPYHALYEKGLVAGLMVLWPLLGLGGILLILFKYKYILNLTFRLQAILLLILSIVALAWDTALYPPFSGLKSFLVSHVPLIVKVMPWSIGLHYLKFIYLVSVSYTIGYIISRLSFDTKIIFNNIYKIKIEKIILIIILIITIGSLLYTSLPIFTGKVFGQYYNEKIKGFYLPKDYLFLYRLKTRFYEHILLLPPTHTYASTKWGWQGSVSWYNGLNSAILTYTFAPYSQYTDWKKIYNELTRPCLRITNEYTITRYIDLQRIKILNGRVIRANMLSDGSLYLKITLFRGKYTDIIMPLNHALNISMYKALEIYLSAIGKANITIAPWLFIYSGKEAGAHILPYIRIPGNATKTYVIGAPDKPWPASRYDPSKVNALLLRIKIVNQENINPLTINIKLKVAVGNSLALCKSYMELLKLLNIKYIVIDKSLQTYNLYYKFINNIFKKIFKNIYNGNILDIYETNISTSPLHILQPNKVELKILREAPSDIEAKLTQGRVSNITFVTPLLYSEKLPNPIKVTIQQGKSFFHITTLDYKGLRGYKINRSNNLNSIKITINYTISFKLIYITLIILNIIPLMLLFLSLILYAMNLRECVVYEK